jgi:YfiH family protein
MAVPVLKRPNSGRQDPAQDEMSVRYRFQFGPINLAFTDRTGRSNGSLFDGANLSFHVGDLESAVEANRAEVGAALGISTAWLELEQVHGADVVKVDEDEAWKRAATGGWRPKADAVICSVTAMPVAVFTADCVPIALVREAPAGLALVHAGWRGLMAGVVDNAVSAIGSEGKNDIFAIVGPAIGACCYEVGEDLLDRFARRFGPSVVRRDQSKLDLPAAAAKALQESGLSKSKILHLEICTSCSGEFFSYRRSHGTCGRQAVIGWIEDR